MKLVSDETREFRDEDGDALVLRALVRQRDVLAVQAVEQAEAFEAMKAMREAGIDPQSLIASAEAPERREDSPKVKEAKLAALAVRLVIGGEAFGGQAIVDAYRNMDVRSAAWVDACVAQVWDAGTLGDEGARAQAPVARPVHEPAGAHGQHADGAS